MTLGIVIYLDTHRVQFYEPRGGAMVTLDLTEAMVRDGDVVDRAGFQAAIQSVLRQHKLSSVPVGIVVSEDMCFWQDLTGDESQKEAQVQQFLERVPFDATMSRRYVFGEKEVVLAAPKSLYEPLRQILAQEGLGIMFVVPSFVLGMQGKRWLDAETGKHVASTSANLVAQSIMGKEDESYIQPLREHTFLTKKQQRPAILIAIFAILAVVLFTLIIRQ